MMTMMKKSSLFLFLSVLCLGQTCVPDTAEPVTVIPQGSYTGEVTTRLQAQSSGAEPSESTSVANEIVVFSAEGLPMVGANTSVYVGYEGTSSVGGTQITQTITAITPVENGLVVDFDASLVAAGTSSTVTLEGNGRSTYTLRSDGGLDYSTTMTLATSESAGDDLSIDVASNGRLTR